ncbi:MAG: hypothetical protein QXP36_04070 [Conexivisphaerales archaeon]
MIVLQNSALTTNGTTVPAIVIPDSTWATILSQYKQGIGLSQILNSNPITWNGITDTIPNIVSDYNHYIATEGGLANPNQPAPTLSSTIAALQNLLSSQNSPSPTPSTTPSTTTKKSETWLYIGLGAAVLVIVVILVIYFKNKGKGKKK